MPQREASVLLHLRVYIEAVSLHHGVLTPCESAVELNEKDSFPTRKGAGTKRRAACVKSGSVASPPGSAAQRPSPEADHWATVVSSVSQ